MAPSMSKTQPSSSDGPLSSFKWIHRRKYLHSHPLLQKESNQRLLETSSEAADQLRREITCGANLLVVGGGFHRLLIYDKIKSQNINLYILDEPDSDWAKFKDEDISKGRICGFIPCRLSPIDGVESRARTALEDVGINADNGFFAAIISYHDEELYAAGLIAREFNMDFNDAEAYNISTNKFLMRETLRTKNLVAPKFRQVETDDDMMDACNYLGFPMIVKLANGTHSLGVYEVSTCEEAVKAMTKCRMTNRKEFSATSSSVIVVEEMLQGIEVDVDILLSFGQCVYAKISDNWRQPPYFQDYGIHLPSRLDSEIQEHVIARSVEALTTLGFRNGSFNCEGIYNKSNNGFQFLEFNARVGCGPVIRNHEVTWGVNHMEQHTFAALGMPIKPVIPEKCLTYCCGLMMNAPYSGTINSDVWLDHLKAELFVSEVRYNRQKGDEVVGPEKDVPTVLAVVNLISDQSQDDMNKKLVEFLQTLPVPVDPDDNVEKKPFYTPGMVFPFVEPPEQFL